MQYPLINSKISKVSYKDSHHPRAKYIKFLGLLLDENLNWKYHFSELSRKLSRTCGIFFKVRHLLLTNILVSLYNSLFSSFLQYGIIVWGLTYEVHTNPIYFLQKKVVRAIAFKSFTSPSTPTFSELKILKLYDLFELKLLTFVYESVTMISPICFHKFFDTLTSVHQYDTRQADKGDIFKMRKSTLQYSLRSVRYAGATSWNSIPSNIKQSTSIMIFRRDLKLHLFSTKYQF